MSFWTFMAGLIVGLIPLVIAGWLWQRKKAQLEAEKTHIESEREEQAKSFVSTQHSRDLAELEQDAQAKLRAAELRSSHEEKIERLDRTHRRKIHELRDTYQEELAERTQTQHEELERVRAQLAYRRRWERDSRVELARVCDLLGVNGFLATDVCFLAYDPQTGPYVHQIDHLIVSHDMLFVVEAKYWKGNVYHREKSSNTRDKWAIDDLPMLRHVGPRERYVLSVKNDGDLFWRPSKDGPEPVTQVQTQTVKFREFLTAKLVENPGEIFNCVFYSHPDVTLTGGARPFGKYTWITQTRELPDVLKRLRDQRNSANPRSVDVEAIQEIVLALGADIIGLGSYEEIWRSTVPLVPRNGPTTSSGPSQLQG